MATDEAAACALVVSAGSGDKDMKGLMIQEIRNAYCDVCLEVRARAVLVEMEQTQSFVLCSRDLKAFARMLLDRTSWYKPPPLKPGEILIA